MNHNQNKSQQKTQNTKTNKVQTETRDTVDTHTGEY